MDQNVICREFKVKLNQIKNYVTHSTDNNFFICSEFDEIVSIILKICHYKLYTENSKYRKLLHLLKNIKLIIFLFIDNIKIFTVKIFKVSKKLLRLKTKVLDIDK